MMNRKHSSRGWSSMEPQNSYRIESTKMSVNTSKKPPFATQRPKLPVSAIDRTGFFGLAIDIAEERSSPACSGYFFLYESFQRFVTDDYHSSEVSDNDRVVRIAAVLIQ